MGVEQQKGTPVVVRATCYNCGWKLKPDQCPLCAKTAHEEDTGHKVFLDITAVAKR